MQVCNVFVYVFVKRCQACANTRRCACVCVRACVWVCVWGGGGVSEGEACNPLQTKR